MAQIGTVGVSQRLEAQPNPTVDPRRFGAGVAEALGTLANAVDGYSQSTAAIGDSQAGLNAQYAERQRRLVRANAEVGLVRMNAELDREIVTLSDGAARDGAGFTDTVKDLTDKRTAAFLATLPEEIRPEYAGRIEGIRQASITNGFEHQIKLEDAAYKTDLTDLAQQAIDSIKSGRSTAENWAAQLENMKSLSPLGELQTEELFAVIEKAVQTADMQTAAAAIALAPEQGVGTTGGPADGSDIVAAGMPGMARGLLNTIAGTESGGAYNIITSGGGTFTSYADHPRKYVPLAAGQTSSAAGRYQFIGSTWDEAAAALGLTSFSPENQDRAAWWLAQRDYKQKSGGRDLVLDLQSGNFTLVAGVRRTLATTWEGLKSLTDEEFFAQVQGQSGTPSSLMDSPQYSALSYDERLAIVADAEKTATDIRTQTLKDSLAKREAGFNSLQMAIDQRQAGMADILAFSKENQLTYEEQKKLIDQFNAKNEQLVSAANYMSSLTAPGFNPGSAESKKGADAQFALEGQTALASGDSAYVANTFVPLAQRSGYIPAQAEQQLAAQLQSSDPKVSGFAQQTLAALEKAAPQAFARLDPSVQQDVVFAQQAGAYMTPAELQESLRQRRDPTMAGIIEERKKEAAKLLAPTDDMSRSVSLQNLLDEFGPGFATTDPFGSQMLERDFALLFAENYAKYPDEKLARAAAVEQLKKVYGPTSVSGDEVLMRYPPEQVYPPFQNSHDYLRETLVRDFALPEGSKFFLVSDTKTEQQVRSGQMPSYVVMLQDSDGVFYPADAPTGQENAAGRSRLARISFPITAEMQSSALDQTVKERQIMQLAEDAQRLEIELSVTPPADPAVREQLQSQLNTLNWEIANIKGENPKPTNKMMSDEIAAQMKGRAIDTSTTFPKLAEVPRLLREVDMKLEVLQTTPMEESQRARLQKKYLDERTQLLSLMRKDQQ